MKRSSFLISFIRRNAGTLSALLILCIVISIRSNTFLTVDNITNVLRQISQNVFLTCGITLILIAGGIDLSVGSIIGLVGVFAAMMLGNNVPVVVTILICLLFGALIGSINGFILSRTPLPPFIVTYAMMTALRGITYILTDAATIRVDNRAFINLGTGYFIGIPLPVWYMTVVIVLVFVILKYTKLGRHIYAVGGNEKAALYSGINVKNTRLFVYVFSGVMAAIAGLCITARSYAGTPTAGQGAEMDAIAAAVIGGTSMMGGSGYIGGTVIGALIIGVMNNGLNLMHVSSYWQQIAKGVIVLLAVYVDYLRNINSLKKKEKK